MWVFFCVNYIVNVLYMRLNNLNVGEVSKLVYFDWFDGFIELDFILRFK